ncbi:CRP-like cAMP-activated global transcriptional regulator [Myxococcaceae bacterium]|jgi:CRP-like cAMP-binding protein|nr:CRP-like cAMP-activated global transcriptional regulator [Myxococcaceae bacterium]
MTPRSAAPLPAAKAAASLDAAAAIERVPLFESLDADDRRRLLAVSSVRRVPARRRLFRRGEPGHELFVLLRGRCKALAVASEGRGTVFAVFEPGEVVGEIALLDGGPRTATVTTMSACDFLVIGRADLLTLLESEPAVAIRLLAACAARLRHTSELVEELVFLSLPARLARKLLQLARDYGSGTGSGTHIALKLSQRELAELVGASRESVNRQLGHWEQAGVLRHERGFITLLDSAVLRRLASLVIY